MWPVRYSKATPKLHEHMVIVLAMLTAGADNADTNEPLFLKQVSPHWPEFEKAMQQEYGSLIKSNMWELVPTPNQAVLTGRWVFKIKKDRMDNILKFKVRWVAHGYKQKEGLDFTNTFASVSKPMSWKAMIGVSAKRGYKIWQMDVVTAYLFGFLDEKVNIYQPTLMDDSTGRVCMLKKALYGLKQSACIWYQTLQDFLKKLCFKRVEANHGFFVSNNKSIFIAVYVDDILFFGAPNNKQIQDAIQDLQDQFQMTDLGEVSHYLGMEIDNNVEKKIVTLLQSTYLKKIVSHYGFEGCRPAKVPMSPGVPNSLDPNTSQATKDTITWYQSAVGALMWPVMHSRPDSTQSVAVLAQLCSNSSNIHIALVKQVLRYISGIIDKGLVF
ncbi:Reverse transcriptase, RNA-dependent DNA polymerase [Lasallia pustulata]|uniref:Reverse transcriptase, RNA-dependent DNA polymerase n=1 Tax=Lasallia pustulata TaxID=136370 RepID=A0A1W5D5P9_9LECA|nr:Reverse transcriptase, RNA-dependent DNA polymerase [Lasallia pustulata]